MPRYIDVERIPNDSFWESMTPKEKAKVLQWFLQTPTADVEGVKYSKWLTEHARHSMLSGAVVEWDRKFVLIVNITKRTHQIIALTAVQKCMILI